MKILCYTDLTIAPKDLFWHRDLGLLTKAFRKLGHKAWLVVHPATASARKPKPGSHHGPVLWASPADVRSPAWWQGHQPDLVILGLWTRPKYDPVRRAALTATPRIIERADSDGMRTASCGLIPYFWRRHDFCRDFFGRVTVFGAAPLAIAYAVACVIATPWMEARLRQTLRLLPAVAVETPEALRSWRGLARRLGCLPSRIHGVPPAVQSDLFELQNKIRKKKQVIAVGRWDSYQKNFPALLRLLVPFVKDHPDWSARIVGIRRPDHLKQPRLYFHPRLAPARLADRMKESQVFLFTSRYEGCLLAGAEAVLAGCAVLGPPEVPCSSFYRSFSRNRLGLGIKNKKLVGLPGPREPALSRAIRRQVRRAATTFAPKRVACKMLAIAQAMRVSE